MPSDLLSWNLRGKLGDVTRIASYTGDELIAIDVGTFLVLLLLLFLVLLLVLVLVLVLHLQFKKFTFNSNSNF